MKLSFATLVLFFSHLFSLSQPSSLTTEVKQTPSQKVTINQQPAAPQVLSVHGEHGYALTNSVTTIMVEGGKTPYTYDVSYGGLQILKIGTEVVYYKAPATVGEVKITIKDAAGTVASTTLSVVIPLVVSPI